MEVVSHRGFTVRPRSKKKQDCCSSKFRSRGVRRRVITSREELPKSTPMPAVVASALAATGDLPILYTRRNQRRGAPPTSCLEKLTRHSCYQPVTWYRASNMIGCRDDRDRPGRTPSAAFTSAPMTFVHADNLIRYRSKRRLLAAGPPAGYRGRWGRLHGRFVRVWAK